MTPTISPKLKRLGTLLIAATPVALPLAGADQPAAAGQPGEPKLDDGQVGEGEGVSVVRSGFDDGAADQGESGPYFEDFPGDDTPPGPVGAFRPPPDLGPAVLGDDDSPLAGEGRGVEITTEGPTSRDPGPSVTPPPGDDAPVTAPVAKSAADAKAVGTAAAACYGTQYQVRGGSLIPPYGGWLIYWDAPGSGYEVRGMRGIECLGENYNYTVAYSNVQAASNYNATWGRKVTTKDGYVYEGCRKEDQYNRYWCDFSANRSKPSRLTTNQSSQYWWKVLRDWGAYQAATTAACGMSVVGLWVGANDLGDAGSNCIEAGPYTPG